MSVWALYAAAAAGVAAAGLVGAFRHEEEPVRRVLAINIASSGVFLVLVALARRAEAGPADPVPHALVLTGIVVSLSATALALSIARRLAARSRP